MSDFSDLFTEAAALTSEFFGEDVTYTTAEGSTSTVRLQVFRFFIGALDDVERGDAEIPKSETTPNEGDYFVRSGETERWYIADIRERPSYWAVLALRTKDRT